MSSGSSNSFPIDNNPYSFYGPFHIFYVTFLLLSG
nr:MAG TPA: hypothetical protein [Caudoviricetes sp.]